MFLIFKIAWLWNGPLLWGVGNTGRQATYLDHWGFSKTHTKINFYNHFSFDTLPYAVWYNTDLNSLISTLMMAFSLEHACLVNEHDTILNHRKTKRIHAHAYVSLRVHVFFYNPKSFYFWLEIQGITLWEAFAQTCAHTFWLWSSGDMETIFLTQNMAELSHI